MMHQYIGDVFPTPGICPGCGRCRHCGQPYHAAPYWQPYYGGAIGGGYVPITTTPNTAGAIGSGINIGESYGGTV